MRVDLKLEVPVENTPRVVQLCGIFDVPEQQFGVLGDVAGLDVVELGCGTAYLSAGLARRGARPPGVDLTPAQLATARRCQQRSGIFFPLIEADAGDVPLPSGSFDLARSECGASLWCDPARWARRMRRFEIIPGQAGAAWRGSPRRPRKPAM